jgi:leader peptidase (prepilin peptidase)/N-methyltransferase
LEFVSDTPPFENSTAPLSAVEFSFGFQYKPRYTRVMQLLVGTVLFIFGSIIGSFLNVVILRYGSGRHVTGRSGCLSCGKKLSWRELVPIVSFLALRGRCRGCRTPLSVQYPLVECATGLLFSAVGLHTIGTAVVLAPQTALVLGVLFTIVSLLVVIFVYDLRHKIIPDAFAYSFAGFGLLYALLTATSPIPTLIFDRLSSALLITLPFFAIWYFSKGRAMGLGDAKLALGMGTLFGTSLGYTAVVFGFWVGAVVGLLLMAIQYIQKKKGRLTMKSEIAFGPFLIIGMGIVFFTGINLFDLGGVFALGLSFFM